MSSLEEARTYDNSIPTFLKNRPVTVVKHCYRRWEDSVNISEDDIDHIGEGQFLVRSQTPESSQVYTVNFSPGEFPLPSCSCEDWRKYHLICKHFCAVFRNTPWKWEKLPEEYRNNPFITIDDDVVHIFNSSPAYTEGIHSCETCIEESEPYKESQPLPVPNKSRLAKLRSHIGSICQVIKDNAYNCRDEDVLQSLCTKLEENSKALKSSLGEETEFVLSDPDSQMIHISTVNKKISKLSLPKKRRKEVGRYGSSAERVRMHTSKGIGDLLNGESGKFP